jgi:signal transduction histidine kinase
MIDFFRKTILAELQNQDFETRKLLTLIIPFWFNLAVQIWICFLRYPHDMTEFYFAIVTIILCLISYAFVLKNQYSYATFWGYFPMIFIQAMYSFHILHKGETYSTESTLCLYAAICVMNYDFWMSVVGLSINFLLFIAIKIYKFNLFPELYESLFIELSIDVAAYTLLIFLSLMYIYDFIKLKVTNENLGNQQKIMEAQAETLKVLNTTKDHLFGIIAHDLRSPISSLKGIMEMLKDGSLSREEFNEISQRLQYNLDNVYGMLDNLLLWSLSQMGKIKPDRKVFVLNTIIDETVILLNEMFTEKQIKFQNYLTQNIEVIGDEYQIKTIFRNLLHNSLKFTANNGTIQVNSSTENDRLLLQLTDTGVGIKEDNLNQIFLNPYVNKGTLGEKGTGFGLLLCKELIEKNNGLIDIKSSVGKGTTVIMSLPISDTKGF